MYLKWIFIAVVFLAGVYTTLNYNSIQFKEGFEGQTRCPDILIQDGEQLILKNSSLAEVPGVNPVRFKNLEEYAEFVQWQRSQGINCPVLYYTKSYDAQSHEGYLPAELPPISEVPNPFAFNPDNDTYPEAIDPHNQEIGENSKTDQYYYAGKSFPVSASAMETNWGGADFSMKAVDHTYYKSNEAYRTAA
jgi:hypothetical protein